MVNEWGLVTWHEMMQLRRLAQLSLSRTAWANFL